MKYKLIVSFFLIILLYGCNADKKGFEEKFYTTKSQKWENYFKQVGMDMEGIKNSIFLFVRTTGCAPCLKELAWWNEHWQELEGAHIMLIVIEKYAQTYHAFLSQNKITLHAYRDSGALVLKRNLIPYPPVKIYFNENSKVSAIEKIGTNGNLGVFLAKIQEKP